MPNKGLVSRPFFLIPVIPKFDVQKKSQPELGLFPSPFPV
jgi:hypothetical protein